MFIITCEIVGLILLLVVCFVQRHTFCKSYAPGKNQGRYVRLQFSVKEFIIFFIIGITPILSIIGFLLYTLLYFDAYHWREDFVFSLKNISGQE